MRDLFVGKRHSGANTVETRIGVRTGGFNNGADCVLVDVSHAVDKPPLFFNAVLEDTQRIDPEIAVPELPHKAHSIGHGP